ncbi:hypothetical protein RB195_020431 [Necator americanus]|uniref:Uncharacterized protein n=1 Tax=Necator americanus TaxID=51031 RepID=A0ABR1CKL3_NECAM
MTYIRVRIRRQNSCVVHVGTAHVASILWQDHTYGWPWTTHELYSFGKDNVSSKTVGLPARIRMIETWVIYRIAAPRT